MVSRRSFILGLTGAIAAPAIVRADSLMRIVVPKPPKMIVYHAITTDMLLVNWTDSGDWMWMAPSDPASFNLAAQYPAHDIVWAKAPRLLGV